MEFFNSAVDTLQTIVVGLGGALCVSYFIFSRKALVGPYNFCTRRLR